MKNINLKKTTMEKLIKKLVIKTEITLLTGLHIGGNKDSVEIGGIDNPVIKIGTKKGEPYIPGSSLKGKIRSLLEQIHGISEVGGGRKGIEKKTDMANKINDLFGYADDYKPSKIIFRDAYLTEDSLKKLTESGDFLDMPFTENKYENTIDRKTGITVRGGLRQTERVPAGVSFDLSFVLNIWDNDEDGKKSLNLLKEGIYALEHDYLGGSGSRGYGQISITTIKEYSNYVDYDKESKEGFVKLND